MPQPRAPLDELHEVVTREFGDDVVRAVLRGDQQPADVGALLLEQEDVPRLLLVHPAADDAERPLVRTGLRQVGATAPPLRRLLHEPRDVVVDVGERLLDECS